MGPKPIHLSIQKNRLEIQLQISSKNEVELAKKKTERTGISEHTTHRRYACDRKRQKKEKPGANYKDLLKIAEIPEIVFVGK